MAVPSAENLFSHVRNRGVFSGHWLDHRLELEPEWTERQEDAADALTRLGQLWAKERDTIDKHGSEQGLEYAFIQPVMEALGWKLRYQTHLHGHKPDYALFATDEARAASFQVDHKSDDFWQAATLVADAKQWDLPSGAEQFSRADPLDMPALVTESEGMRSFTTAVDRTLTPPAYPDGPVTIDPFAGAAARR
jgi:hypothetical protein